MSSTARSDSGPGVRIGVIAGTPVYLGRSWPLIVLLVLLIVVPTQGSAGGSLGQSVVIAVAFALMLLVSVLVHEAAHALVALWRGHRVDRIVADVWGGHTVYDATSSTPVTTALVAVAGPLSNLALAAVSWLVRPYASGTVVGSSARSCGGPPVARAPASPPRAGSGASSPSAASCGSSVCHCCRGAHRPR